jgi:GGDEF domain-containing protein
VLRRIQHAVENASAAAPLFSLSVGCVQTDLRKPVSILTLLEQADRTMYEHKARGSRRLNLAPPAGP